MSPSLKNFDNKAKCVRLTQNCLVVSLRKSSVHYLNNSQNDDFAKLDNQRSESWADNTDQISPAALSLESNESETYLTLPSTSPTLQCTCTQVDGWTLFNQFLKENSSSVWNPYLVSCLSQLKFLGFLYPSTLLIGGTDFSLEVLRSAWSRRILKAPQGFEIEFIGDISYIETSLVNQTQFTPLAEALCKCINELNVRQISATFNYIINRLKIEFPNMELPSERILRNCLKSLVQERKIYYNHENESFVALSYDYQLNNSYEHLENLSDKKLTSEEAFTRLHGQSQKYGSEVSSISKRSYGTQVDFSTNRKKRDSFASNSSTSAVTHRNQTYLDNNSQTQNASSLRRSSSLRFESHKGNNLNKASNFKRSKSFKLSRGKHEIFNQIELSNEQTCKCKIDSNRKQSVLSKFLRLGNPVKSKSLSKSSNFCSQFPEVNNSVIPYNGVYKSPIERKSKSTQTIKCGPEECATLIIKQASRHALAKNRYNNNDRENKNWVSYCIDCCDCESNHCKYNTRHNKPSNKRRYGPKIELPVTPTNECELCNVEPHKIDSNRHDYTNNNYWSKSNQQLCRQLNGLHKFDNTIKQNERLANYNSVEKKLLTHIDIRTNDFKEQNNEVPEDRLKSYQTPKNLLTSKTSRLNNSQSIIEKSKNKTQVINTSLESQYPKESPFKYTQNHTSFPIQSHDYNQTNGNSNQDLLVDNSVNVKIEIDSTSTSTVLASSDDKSDDHTIESYRNSLTSTVVSSNSVDKPDIEQHMGSKSSSIKHPVITSATTVTTTMTLPNFYNNNKNNHKMKTNWVQTPTETTDIVKNLKSCNEEMNATKISNKQNNLLSDLRINSIPHLSPIRQKVAKAKAEFFNSTSPQTPLVSDLLIEK